MSNCIDCQHVIETDKYGNIHQCEYANENVKECIYYKNAKIKKTELGVVHIDMDYEKEAKEMLE